MGDVERIRVDVALHPITLLGACQGLGGEAAKTVEAIEGLEPETVALALGPKVAMHVHELPPDARLGVEDEAYSEGLRRYGDVRLPPPEFEAAIEAADDVDATVEGVDLSEEAYMERFTAEVGVLDLTMRALRVRWLKTRPPSPADATAFCRRFDERANTGPFADLERIREETMARRVAELADEGPTVLVVEVQRSKGVERALRRPAPREA